MSRITAQMDVPESEQRDSFQNATLQGVKGARDVAFSIATHVEVPEHLTSEGEVYDYLVKLLGGHIASNIHFEIQVGPADL